MSSYYEQTVLKDIIEKKERKEQGEFNGIPFPFSRYQDYIPSIDKGMYYGILGNSGLGKSRFIRNTFVYKVLEFSWMHKYPVKIIYFALEDGKLLVYKKFIKHYLWERHKINLPQKYIDSKDKPLDQKYLDVLQADKDFYENLEKSIYIINNATTPNEIYNVCMKVINEFGATHHIVGIIDNYANITKDDYHKSEWEAVRELSRNKIRLDLCLKHNMTMIAVLQTDFDTEKFTARNAGKAGIASVEPNMGSIGDVKVIARDMFVLLALFSPWKYEIERYPYAEGYRIDVLRDRFRSVLMLKNNEGEMAPRLPLYFDGANEIFAELPRLEEADKLEMLYLKIIKEEKERKEKLGNSKLF